MVSDFSKTFGLDLPRVRNRKLLDIMEKSTKMAIFHGDSPNRNGDEIW